MPLWYVAVLAPCLLQLFKACAEACVFLLVLARLTPFTHARAVCAVLCCPPAAAARAAPPAYCLRLMKARTPKTMTDSPPLQDQNKVDGAIANMDHPWNIQP